MWLIHLLHILFADKSIILLLAKLPLSFPLHILTVYHKAPTSQDSIAQRAEDEISASPRVDTRQDLVGRWKVSPRGPTAYLLVSFLIFSFYNLLIDVIKRSDYVQSKSLTIAE